MRACFHLFTMPGELPKDTKRLSSVHSPSPLHLAPFRVFGFGFTGVLGFHFGYHTYKGPYDMRHHILDNSLDKLPQNPMQTTVSVFLYCADLIWSHRGQMTHTFHPVLPSSRFWTQACVTNCLDGLFIRPQRSLNLLPFLQSEQGILRSNSPYWHSPYSQNNPEILGRPCQETSRVRDCGPFWGTLNI